MPSEMPPTGDSGRVSPIDPVYRTGDATRKAKDQPEASKKKRVHVREDGRYELLPDDGEPIVVTQEDLARRYHDIFGEEMPPGGIVDIEA